jgi:rfaE bifunctional protein nucleotidyltransferase chain/domain
MQKGKPVVFSSVEEVADFLRPLRAGGKTLVTTNGCFDLLHTGHVKYLLEAASLGDLLVVGINSDASVRKLKGISRPIQKGADRAFLVASLKMVDCAFLFEEDDPRAFLEVLRPDIHVKGGDYLPERLPEKETVEKHGGVIRMLNFEQGYSTSSIVDRIIKSAKQDV